MDKEKQLLRDLGEVNEKFIEEADTQLVQTSDKRSGKITWKYFAAFAAAAAAILILVRLPERNRNDDIVPPADNNQITTAASSAKPADTSETSVPDIITKITAVPNTDAEAAAEPESPVISEHAKNTEPLPVLFTGSGKDKPQDYSLSRQKSYLNIQNSDSAFYSVEDGYYRLHFLSDSDLENRINQDIKAAMDDISKWYDPGYLAEKDGSLYPWDWVNRIANSHGNNTELEKANGQAIELICENGYLSVALGYLDCDGYIPGGDGREYGYERRWDVVRTLNYDLKEKKKIEKFTDLFYEGTDVLSKLNTAVFDDMANDKAESITDYPEYFTIYYILQDNNGKYYNKYDTLLFNDSYFNGDIISSMVTSEYRDMSDIISSSLYENIRNIETEDLRYKIVEENGIKFARIESANFTSESEIEKLNEDIKTLQHKAYERFGRSYEETYNHKITSTVYASLCEGNVKNIWSVSGIKKEGAYFYDAGTLELLRPEDFIGENWTDYIVSGEYKEQEYILELIQTADDEFLLLAYVDGDYDSNLQIIVPDPYSVINPEYLAD